MSEKEPEYVDVDVQDDGGEVDHADEQQDSE